MKMFFYFPASGDNKSGGVDEKAEYMNKFVRAWCRRCWSEPMLENRDKVFPKNTQIHKYTSTQVHKYTAAGQN